MTALMIDSLAGNYAEVEYSTPLAPVIPLRPVASPKAVVVRYEWTDHGIAVMVASALAVMAVMAVTLVGSFLSISNDPVPVASAPISATQV